MFCNFRLKAALAPAGKGALQHNKVLVLASVVRDLATRARLVANFLNDGVEHERMLRYAEDLDAEVARLETLALAPATDGLQQQSDSAA